MKRLIQYSFLCLIVLGANTAFAKTAKDIAVKDFFKNPDYSSLQLSPNGEFLAARVTVNDRNNIIVMETNDLNKYQFLTGFTDSQVASFFWASDDRIVFTMDSSNGGEAFGLYTVKREKKPEIVTLLAASYQDRSIVSARIVNTLPDEPNHVIVSYNRRYVRAPDLYKLALDSKWHPRRKSNSSMELIAKNPGNVDGWLVDHDGDVRGAITTDGLKGEFLYKNKGEKDFRTIQSFGVFDEGISPLRFAYDNKTLYVASNIGRDRAAIYTYDPEKNKMGDMIYGNDKVDVTGLIMSRKQQKLLGVSYYDDYPERVYFDKTEKKLAGIFKKTFPGKIVSTVSMNREENLRVLSVSNDMDPGGYYLFDSKTNKLSKLTTRMRSIDSKLMSPMKPFEFASRDGLTVRGYVTIPKESNGKKLPLIINPHGGPFGVRDRWGFRQDVQFFASRGYAVAQVNFRGSGGYGREFEQAGYGAKWGAEMQHDVTDTVKYLVKEGIVDADRVCIYGGSYGGYATMAGLTFTPEMYKCGINNVGVTDVGLLFTSMPKHWENAKEALKVQIGDPDDKELMDRMSPIAHVEDIKAPVFIIHGKNDPRVVYKHADMLMDEMDKLDKPYEKMVKSGEGHGFRKQENRIEMYTRIEKFLEEHL